MERCAPGPERRGIFRRRALVAGYAGWHHAGRRRDESVPQQTPALAAAPHGLPIERVRTRIAAYIYGDIIVLGVLLALDSQPPHPALTALTVGAATVFSYIAHVFAHAVGDRAGRPEGAEAFSVREDLRDAWPIASTGLIPTAILLLVAFGVLPGKLGVLLAVTVVLIRLAAVGFVTARLTGQRASLVAVAGGLLIAAVGATVAAIEAVVVH